MKSIEAAILTFLGNVSCANNNGSKCSGIFIEFSKAFDVVDDKILLNKQEVAGIRGKSLNWFESLLIIRIHNSSKQEWLNVHFFLPYYS